VSTAYTESTSAKKKTIREQVGVASTVDDTGNFIRQRKRGRKIDCVKEQFDTNLGEK
jgi:hypothetical protein